MANYSDFLNLVLPGFMEYRDSWWEPVNDNFTQLDSWAQDIDQEITEARFTKASLKDFLAVAHTQYGQLLPTPEVITARRSPVYGFQTPAPETDFELGPRIDQGDWEVFYAREGKASLRELSAFRFPAPKNQILTGTMNVNGYPTWMGSSGAIVRVDGSVTPIWMTIDGALGRIRTLREVTISGGVGDKYVYAEILPDDDIGKIVLDGDSTTPPPAAANGTTSLDTNDNHVFFNDATITDFSALDIEAGDILTLLDSTEVGDYIIKEVTPDGVLTQLLITGVFPGSAAVSGINYLISDPLRVNLTFSDSEPTSPSQLCLGQVYWDGAAVSDIRTRHFRDSFVSEWVEVQIDGTNGGPNLGTPIPNYYEALFAHKLGTDRLEVEVQVSQANDGTLPIERLAMTSLSSTLNVSITNGLSVTPSGSIIYTPPTHGTDVFVPGTSDASFVSGGLLTPGSITDSKTWGLTGSVTGNLTGAVVIDNAVRTKWDKNYIWIKNVVSGQFYKDYDGNVWQTGYLRVIVRKRG